MDKCSYHTSTPAMPIHDAAPTFFCEHCCCLRVVKTQHLLQRCVNEAVGNTDCACNSIYWVCHRNTLRRIESSWISSILQWKIIHNFNTKFLHNIHIAYISNLFAPTGGQFSLWGEDNLHRMHTSTWPFLNTVIMNVNIYSWNTRHFQAITFAYGTSVNF